LGLKKEGDDQYHCWDERLQRKVAFTPEKGVYDISTACRYQPRMGSFGNVLDVIRLPHDSLVKICGEIDEGVLDEILAKLIRKLSQKSSQGMPMEIWIAELQARLDKDKLILQEAQKKVRERQIKQGQHPTNAEQLHRHLPPGKQPQVY
jgi:hypothetical protein